MVGNIICPVQFGSGGFNPDDYFDPTTHIATEADFIKLLEKGIYDSSLIGYKVQLANSWRYNNGLWVIADANHDSANTGQTNCYDLISVDCIYPGTYYSSSYQNWRYSDVRGWLNNNFYPGFSTDFKARMLNIKYNSEGSWYDDDKIIMPSYKEVNGGTIDTDDAGIAYPIFTDKDSRKKCQAGTSIIDSWWTRSRYMYNSSYVWYVYSDGDVAGNYYGNNFCVVPLMRVQ